MCSCAAIGTKLSREELTPSLLNNKFKKICLEGTGKGRIELVGSKHVFSYESLTSHSKNIFEMALDFPIVGETKITLNLNSKEILKQINHSDLVAFLEKNVGRRDDRDQIIKAIEEFFILTSDFVYHRTSGIYPTHFVSKIENDHFILERITPNYSFQIDNFSENKSYFERTTFKIFLTIAAPTDPIMTLFLVPQSCDH